MITIIVPEWLLWIAIGWACISAVLQFINIIYRIQIKTLEQRNDAMIQRMKDDFEGFSQL